MANQVLLKLNKHVLNPKNCVIFDVRSHGRKIGSLEVGKGDIRWFPKYSKTPIRLKWKQFDQLIRENG